ncbi:MAG: NAD-dependent epimerase/dehydratase family protein, partial [Chloroflexota bacterium]
GLVGSHLCASLIEQGHDVVAVDNFITGRARNIQQISTDRHFTLIEADIVDGVDVTGIDQVYHLASPASPVGYLAHPIETHMVNSIGTKMMLDLAREQDARFLFTSTSEIYGDPLVHPQAETYFGNVNPIGPRSCYDESKRFGESITMDYVRQFDLDARIVRLFNIYGPHNDPDDGRVVPAFIKHALLGKPLTIYGDGSQTRSLCYVNDLVDGLQRAMTCDNTRGKVINMGNPDERTVLELATLITKLCDSSSEIVYNQARPDDPIRRCPDISVARQLLDWEPTTPLNEGLVETIRYFAEHEGILA